MPILSEIVLVKSEKDTNQIKDVHAFALLTWINMDIEIIQKTCQPGNIIAKRFGKERTWFNRTMTKLIAQGFATYEKIITDDNITHRYQVASMQHAFANLQHGHCKSATWEKQENAQILPEVAGTSTPHVAVLAPSIIYKDIKEERENAGASKEIKVENGFAPYKKNHTKFFDPLTSNHQNEYAIREFLQENYINRLPNNPKQWADANEMGVRVWIGTTQTDFDWLQAPLINRRLGINTDLKLLQQAWEEWAGAGHRTSSIGKILDWYDILVADPTATPWKYQGAKTNGQRHSGTSGKAKEGWHGLATSKDKPGTGSKPNVDHLNLPPLILDD